MRLTHTVWRIPQAARFILYERAHRGKRVENRITEVGDMYEKIDEQCGKCGAAIDPGRRVDYTLKDGIRVCEACFIKGSRQLTERS